MVVYTRAYVLLFYVYILPYNVTVPERMPRLDGPRRRRRPAARRFTIIYYYDGDGDGDDDDVRG